MKIGFDYDYYLDETLNVLDIQGFGGVWALPKRSHGNTVICISVASGSLYEPMFSGIDGIAHFLEHRLFWRNDIDVSEMFADLGIEINAYTGFTTTDFVLSGIGNKELCAALDLLLELLFYPAWNLTGIEREKDIIDHELGLYEDDPEWIGYHSSLYSAYGNTRIAGEIAGDSSQLSQIEIKEITDWHKMFYHPSNMMGFISGNSDINELFKVITDKVDGYSRDMKSQCSWKGSLLTKISPIQRSEFKMVRHFTISQPQVFLIFPFDPLLFNNRELVRVEIALDLALDILFGPSGAICEKLYLGGLIGENTLEYEAQVTNEFGFVTINVETDFPNEFCNKLYSGIEDILSDPIFYADLERARRKALGSLVRSYEDSERCVEFLQFAEDLGVRPATYTRTLIDVTGEEVAEVITLFLQGKPRRGALLTPS